MVESEARDDVWRWGWGERKGGWLGGGEGGRRRIV